MEELAWPQVADLEDPSECLGVKQNLRPGQDSLPPGLQI